jgi:hypothetical protein
MSTIGPSGPSFHRIPGSGQGPQKADEAEAAQKAQAPKPEAGVSGAEKKGAPEKKDEFTSAASNVFTEPKLNREGPQLPPDQNRPKVTLDMELGGLLGGRQRSSDMRAEVAPLKPQGGQGMHAEVAPFKPQGGQGMHAEVAPFKPPKTDRLAELRPPMIAEVSPFKPPKPDPDLRAEIGPSRPRE